MPARWDLALGIATGLLTAALWGSWVVITRFGVTTSLTPYDVAFLRYALASLVLAPLLLRHGLGFKELGLGGSLMLVTGAGAPFFIVSATGMRFAPAADIGALLPGAMPLFVALFSAVWLRERFTPPRLLGLGLIVLGILGVGGWALVASGNGAWRGHALFLCGAALWAGYTLVLRRAGLGAWHAAALVNLYSLVGFAPIYGLALAPRLATAPLADVAVQAVVQSVLSGIVGLWAYAQSVRRLGPSRAAAFSALTPVFAVLIAIPVLGEIPDLVTVLAIVAVCVGVVLVSGALARSSGVAAR
jgi:drug/metabolite transporter (DMT)-like permease